jgi:hypothetical protein
MKRLIFGSACLIAALIQSAHGQGISASQSPGPLLQPQPQLRQKPKPGRPHLSPKPTRSIPPTPVISPAQAPVEIPKTGHANANQNPDKVRPKYSEALRRYRHERHDRNWWKQHFTVIVLVGGGYYYWDAGYWCPAWGYDTSYEVYDYDGPIYTYGNLLPDQVILNVQKALKELGYYAGALNGSLGPATRQALLNYQQDAGLDVTGAIDEATVVALGLTS